MRTHRLLAPLVGAVALAAALGLGAGPTDAAPVAELDLATTAAWKAETIPPTGDDVGSHTAAAAIGGVPHVWHLRADGQDLMHTWWSGASWQTETLDGLVAGPNGQVVGSVGSDVSALVVAGAPHVWYHGDGDLRHGWWTGAVWAFETLDGHQSGPNGQVIGALGTSTAAVLYAGAPHVWYRNHGAGQLRHGWWTGAVWAFETLDGHQSGPNGQVVGNVGMDASVTLHGGVPHVFYLHADPVDLRHGWWTGAVWAFETLDGHQNGPTGQTTDEVGTQSSVVIYAGAPHVFYEDITDRDLRHGWWTGAVWAFETLDGDLNDSATGRHAGDAGFATSAVLHGGRPHVFHHDALDGDLRHSWWTGSTWRSEVLDGDGGGNGRTTHNVGRWTVALSLDGRPHVFAYDLDGGDLRHAWYG